MFYLTGILIHNASVVLVACSLISVNKYIEYLYNFNAHLFQFNQKFLTFSLIFIYFMDLFNLL